MTLFQILGIGLTVVVLLGVLRHQQSAVATLLSLGAGVLLLLAVLPYFGQVVGLVSELAARSQVNLAFVGVLLRVIAIAYLVQLAADVARDAGESAVASRIELAGQLLMLVLAVPILRSVIQAVLGLLARI
ncbi:MAG: stage III sporulation protein AD [Firmicutes bacterium]|nr:stage III sporulation protein AD [Bacillota bacterium]